MVQARSLSSSAVEKTIEDYVKSDALAKKAGYDGVEIMGSEGYLINQLSLREQTNEMMNGVVTTRIVSNFQDVLSKLYVCLNLFCSATKSLTLEFLSGT